MATSKQIIDVVYSLFTDNNLSRVLPVLDEQVVLYIPEHLPFGGEYHGRSGFLGLMSAVYTLWDSLSVTSPVYFLHESDSSADAIIVTGTFEGMLHNDNEPIALPFIHYWLLKDQKVIGLRAFYWDSAALLDRLQSKKKGTDRSSNGPGNSESGNIAE